MVGCSSSYRCPSIRRSELLLGEDKGILGKKESSPRQRWCSPRRRGPPRRGSVHLGELEDKFLRFLVSLCEAFARLGKPVTV